MDDLKIRSVLSPGLTSPLQETGKKVPQPEKSFGAVLKEAVSASNQLHMDAYQSVQDLMTGENKNLHETMIALQKADISFKLMMQIRNKLLEAYREISRMQG